MSLYKRREKIKHQDKTENKISKKISQDLFLYEEGNFNIYNDDKNLTFDRKENLTKNEPSYVMTIELEKGKSDIIKIFIDSSPDELAFEFCKKNNLNLRAMNFLSGEISKLLSKITIQSNKKLIIF